jgi:hypothetical protein
MVAVLSSEATILPEPLNGIGIQDLGPNIGVIAG